jgi:tripartite-type tricarboxylate transporter receptor subunit TctC
MKLPRREFLHLAAGAAALPAVSRIARAETYPSRPITMIVPFAAGGATDVVGRMMAERMRVSLGYPVFIENQGAAGGTIGVGRGHMQLPTGTRSSWAAGSRTLRTAQPTRSSTTC